MTALIISFPTDIHALSAQWGLLEQGIACDLLSHADLPGRSVATYDPASGQHSIRAPQVGASAGDYGVVWNRRGSTSSPPSFVDPADWPQVDRSRRNFWEAFALVGAPDAAWVNAHDAKQRANSKAYQLRLAVELGLEIPRTIISNDPAAVRAFVADVGDCIVKPPIPMGWKAADREVQVLTCPVTLADLDQDDAIRACHMIYQQRVEKAVEYRITIFGSEVVCVEIDSQAAEGANVDWRAVGSRNLDMREVECPALLKERLLRFMRSAGLLFGTIDVARTVDGEFIFFEINEQGQFLWMEEFIPGINLLDRLVAFLRHPGEDFIYRPRPADRVLTFAEARDSRFVKDALDEADSRHEQVVSNLVIAE